MADFNYVCHFLRFITLMFLINVSYANNINSNLQQSVIEGPNDIQAKIGDQALLKCRFKNLKGEPQWCIDDFCLGVNKKDHNSKSDQYESNLALKGRPRYRIVGDKSRGEFNLLIEPVQLQDNMYFYCMATAASETIKAVKSRKVFLTVLTYPQSLVLDNPVHVSLNKPSTIQCIARQSRPPVKLLIAINGQIINNESKYKTEIVQLPVKPNQNPSMDEPSNDQNRYKKRYSHATLVQSITPEKLRESYYDTITNLTIDDVTMRMEGQTVECFAYSFMNPHHQNVQMLSFNQNRYSNVGRNSNLNNVMNTKSVIQVDYAPEVNLKMVSSHRLLKEEDVISLVCETKATPAIQSYKWFVGQNYLDGVTDQILNLKLRREMHMQKVTCEASNSVASVKASLRLNILYKPSFVKGTKSYMLIDKNTCNKPLTLDCQVNSNPISNITWYRRRLSRDYLSKFYEKQSSSLTNNEFYNSVFRNLANINANNNNNNNLEHLDEMFEDEMIGTGQTYTIASFNCANLLDNIRNKTFKPVNQNLLNSKNLNKIKYNRLKSKSNKVTVSSTNSPNNQKSKRDLMKKLLKPQSPENQNKIKFSFEDDIEYDDDSFPIKTSTIQDYNENENHEYDEYEDENLNELNNNDKQNIFTYNEYDDFGIYICEARNKYPSDMMMDYYSNLELTSHSSRRYIKINPTGAPILRAMPSSVNSLSFDEITSLMMKSPINTMGSSLDLSLRKKSDDSSESSSDLIKSSSLNQIIEVPAVLGSPITLTCLIEPLPTFKRIVWIKPNGQLISNSVYMANQKYNDLDSSSPNQNRYKFNFKIKYENLTKSSDNIENQTDKNIHFEDSSNQNQNQNGLINVNEAAGMMKSVLYIKNVRKQDLGIYKCKSSNNYGSRSVMILLREKTLIDNLNLNGHFSLIILIVLTFIICILFISMFMCIVSRKVRRICCCCCCRSKKLKKKENLLAHNMQCDINSDKTINEWLVSSKLSNNDTGANNSLINAPAVNNNTNINNINGNQIDISSCGKTSSASSASSKTSKSSELLSTTPTTQLRNDDLMANCSSSLLNDDLDDQQSFLVENNNNTNENINNLNNLKNELETNNNFYQSASQLNRYLTNASQKLQKISSPNDSNSNKISNIGYKTISSSNSPSCKNLLTNSNTNGTLTKLSTTLRPSNYTNGNFNAKISTTCSNLNFPKTIVSNINNNNNNDIMQQTKYNMTSLFNQKTMKTTQQLLNTSNTSKYDLDLDKDYYENNFLETNVNNNNNDFNKLIKDNTYRLSDLFNELSPSLISTNSTNNSKLEAQQAAAVNVMNGTLNRKSPPNSGAFPNPVVTQTPPIPPSRQTLIQAVNSSTSNLNKFPNPFATTQNSNFNSIHNNKNNNNNILAATSSKTSKFYNNFYRANSQMTQNNNRSNSSLLNNEHHNKQHMNI